MHEEEHFTSYMYVQNGSNGNFKKAVSVNLSLRTPLGPACCMYPFCRGVTNKMIKNSSDQLLVSVLGRGRRGGPSYLGRYSLREGSHVKESKTVLDSGFHAVDSGFLVFVSGTWIPDSNC